MIVMLFLSFYKVRLLIKIPSINKCPFETKAILRSALIMVVLPDPDLPAIPIFYPALILIVMFSNTFGKSYLYLMQA
jgi:hypothetical protein